MLCGSDISDTKGAFDQSIEKLLLFSLLLLLLSDSIPALMICGCMDSWASLGYSGTYVRTYFI